MIDAFKTSVATKLNLFPNEIYGHGLSLADVLAKSPTAINSIDMMESFAFAMAENGLEDELQIPAFTLDHSIDEVMEEMERQLKSITSSVDEKKILTGIVDESPASFQRN